MALRSNIQASWIGWGWLWKNKWIANSWNSYIKYLLHDFFIFKHIKIKFKLEEALRDNYAYNYDFHISKTFSKTDLTICWYDNDYMKFGQLTHITQNQFEIIFNTRYYKKIFFFKIFGYNWIIDLIYNPTCFYSFYYFFWQNNTIKKIAILNFSKLSNTFEKKHFLALWPIMLSISFFKKEILGSSNIFFYTSIFHLTKNIIDGFDSHHIYLNLIQNFNYRKQVSQNYLQLSSFLINPFFLKNWPNFVFCFQSWLHQFWISSKKWILLTLAYGHDFYNSGEDIGLQVNFFISLLIKFFNLLPLISTFISPFTQQTEAISEEFLNEQQNAFTFRLKLWKTIVSNFNELWVFLKYYLRYYTWDWIKWPHKKYAVLRWLPFFWWLIWQIVIGYQVTNSSLIVFLNNFFLFKNLNLNFIFKFVFFVIKNPPFLQLWVDKLNKFFKCSLKFLKVICKRFWLNFWSKLNLLHKFINLFFLKIILKKNKFINLIIGEFLPNPIFCFKINTFNHNFFKLNNNFFKYNKISLHFIMLYLSLFPKLFLNTYLNNYTISIPHLSHLNDDCANIVFYWEKVLLTDEQYVFFFDTCFNLKPILKFANWFSISCLEPSIIKLFYFYIYKKKSFWLQKFHYFIFFISHLTIKVFFWIFWDLKSFFKFNLLLQFIVIYWQSFFFFYIFVLKCLQYLYGLSDKKLQLFIAQPNKLFLQKSNQNLTFLDFFSPSFQEFVTLFEPAIWNLVVNELSLKPRFTLVDFALVLGGLGYPNLWSKTLIESVTCNVFSIKNTNLFSFFFVPQISIKYISFTFYKKNYIINYSWKNIVNNIYPMFETWTPMHISFEYKNATTITANLLAIFIKKKLEKEHLIADVFRSLNILLRRGSDLLYGFMFVLKGWFSWRERAGCLWLKWGALRETSLWTRLEYQQVHIWLRYGVACIRIWLVSKNNLDDNSAIL